MQTVWQWRDRDSHPNASWKTIGDGSKPDIWWMQKQYREVEVGSDLYLSTTDSRELRRAETREIRNDA